MDYIGSKKRLLAWMFEHINRHAARLKRAPGSLYFLDGCAGTGAVSEHAAKLGFRVLANDLLTFPAHLVRGKVGFTDPRHLDEAKAKVEQINALPGVEGFFTTSYSPLGGRNFFTEENARRIDAAREFIRAVDDPLIQSYLFYSLIEAVSRVSNTAGTHGAFMKEWKDRARVGLSLQQESTVTTDGVETFSADLLSLLRDPAFRASYSEDILYIDPPYTSRQYAPNYHLYEILVSPTDPVIKGVTGLPVSYAKSNFCLTDSTALETFFRSIGQSTRAELIIVSYSLDGTLGVGEMARALSTAFGNANVEVQMCPAKRYRSASAEEERDLTTDHLMECLFIVARPSNVLDLFG